MPRANRHYIPGCVWHITHRCHKKEFLLKFAKDRKRCLQWLFEAKKRYELSILNYMVTSNHVHLLVYDSGGRDMIPKSVQLVAGRTGQQYNQRKCRKGAFWEDRYHATAVEHCAHLFRCLVYIDLNMVQAGVVNHPSEWPFSGYGEIQEPRQRYALIDYEKLQHLLGIEVYDQLKDTHRRWVEESLTSRTNGREHKWTESIALGSRHFVEDTKAKLGVKASGRALREADGVYELREPHSCYGADFGPKNDALSSENTYFWKVYP